MSALSIPSTGAPCGVDCGVGELGHLVLRVSGDLSGDLVSVGEQGADDFGDGRDVVLDQLHGFAEHRAHALSDCETAQFFGGGPADDQSAELRGDPQQLVHTDAVAVAGA